MVDPPASATPDARPAVPARPAGLVASRPWRISVPLVGSAEESLPDRSALNRRAVAIFLFALVCLLITGLGLVYIVLRLWTLVDIAPGM